VAPVACCIQVDFGSSMSYNYYIPRHTEEEYQRYTPNENRRLETILKVASFFGIGGIGGLALLIGLSYAGFTPDDVTPPWVVWSLVLSFAVSMIGFVAWQAMLAGRDGAVDDALVKERDALSTQVAKMQNDIKRVAAKIKDIKAKGYVVMAEAGAIVNVNSAFQIPLTTSNTTTLLSPKLWRPLLVRSSSLETKKPVRRGTVS
jgi:hypothetical protein